MTERQRRLLGEAREACEAGGELELSLRVEVVRGGGGREPDRAGQGWVRESVCLWSACKGLRSFSSALSNWARVGRWRRIKGQVRILLFSSLKHQLGGKGAHFEQKPRHTRGPDGEPTAQTERDALSQSSAGRFLAAISCKTGKKGGERTRARLGAEKVNSRGQLLTSCLVKTPAKTPLRSKQKENASSEGE